MFAPTDLLLKHGDAEVEIMLLGNKCDCDHQRIVSTEIGQLVSRLHNYSVQVEQQFYNLLFVCPLYLTLFLLLILLRPHHS